MAMAGLLQERTSELHTSFIDLFSNTLLNENQFLHVLGGGGRNPANWKFIQNARSSEACSFFAIDMTTTSHLLMPRDSLPPEDCQLFTLLWWDYKHSHGPNTSSMSSMFETAVCQGCLDNCLKIFGFLPSPQKQYLGTSGQYLGIFDPISPATAYMQVC